MSASAPKPTTCFKCDGANGPVTEELFGHAVCQTCKKNLGLLTDTTILRHVNSFAKAKETDPSQPTYDEEIRERLDFIEKKYLSAKIKLLHIQEQIEYLKKGE